MTLNLLALEVLHYVQDKKQFMLSKSEQKFGRSPSTLKRTVTQINAYLPEEQHLTLKQNTIICTMAYHEKIALIQSLDFHTYSTTIEERLELALFTSFFNQQVNMSELYAEIGVSRATRKKDRARILEQYPDMITSVESFPGKGIKLIGHEAKMRMHIAQRLATLVEFSDDDTLRQRKANNPVERFLCDIFTTAIGDTVQKAQEEIHAIFRIDNLRADYASRKLLLVYFCISTMRIAASEEVSECLRTNMLAQNIYNFYPQAYENKYMHMVVYSLNYSHPLDFPKIPELYEIAQKLVAEIQKRIITKIITYEELELACYTYLYKCLMKNSLGYTFYDDKISDVAEEYPLIVEIISKFNATNRYEDMLLLKPAQVRTMSLIFSTFILRNKVYKEDKQKIIIITNSSSEKIAFWEEQLRKYVDFELVDFLTLNELHYLKDYTYDLIITFSSRITHIMYNLGYLVQRMPFHVEEKDVAVLFKYGFSSNYQRKIEKEKFLAEISGKSTEEISAYISTKYPDYFI